MINGYYPESCCNAPDWFANVCDGQLPVLSVIGKGPVGSGLIVEVAEDSEDTLILNFMTDDTGELQYQTPNIHAGKLSVRSEPADPTPGEQVTMLVTVSRGGVKKTYPVVLPSGAKGSYIYSANKPQQRNEYDTYTFLFSDLYLFGRAVGDGDVETPKVNDLVCFKAESERNDFAICFGAVSATGNNNCVVTVRTYFDVLTPYIGDNGNWWIGDEDTGTPAQGPKGDKGDKGDTGTFEVDGAFDSLEDLINSVKNPQVGDSYVVDGKVYIWNGEEWIESGILQGPKGDKGDPGTNGKSAYDAAIEGGYTGTEEEFYQAIADLTVGPVVVNRIGESLIDQIWANPAGYVPTPDPQISAMTEEQIDAMFKSATNTVFRQPGGEVIEPEVI